MNGAQFEKITRNLNTICHDVKFSEIQTPLFEFGVLTTKDVENIDAISSNEGRLNHICQLLKGKPPEVNAYENFLEALRASDLDYIKELADTIDQTETKSDPAITSKVDPCHFDDEVRRVLLKHFYDESCTETPFKKFTSILCEEKVFSDGNKWTDNKLEEFIKQHFADPEIKSGNRMKEKYVKNVAIHKTAVDESAGGAGTLTTGAQDDTSQLKDVRPMNPTELKIFLQKVYFEKKKLSMEILYEFEKQDITGDVFLTLSEQDLKEIMPSITFGVKRKLVQIIEYHTNLSKAKTDPICESLREFRKDVRHDDYYTRGNITDIAEPDLSRGKKTCPIKNFHFFEKQLYDKNYECIVIEIIQFAAACMNARQDGTIYFGIISEESEQYQAGEIVGMHVEKEELKNQVHSAFKRVFSQDQLKIVEGIMRPIQCIPVQGPDMESHVDRKIEKVFVIEYDFVSSNTSLKNEKIVVNPKPFKCLHKKYKMTTCTFIFSPHGRPKVATFEEECNFDANKSKMIAQREEDEKAKDLRPTPNLREQLGNFVTGGNASLEDDIFPFLILGPFGNDHGDDKKEKSMSFVKHLHPEVIFDFNETGSSSEVYCQLDVSENFRVLTTDNFDSKKSTQDEILRLKQDLAAEKHCHWISCNGDEPNGIKPLGAIEWNKQRKLAFQNTLNCYLEMFKRERILLVICLFSQNTEAIIEACDEILSHLHDQWILLAESKRIAEKWQQIILQRNKVEKKDLLDRCIIGLPWKHVSDCFKEWSSGSLDLSMCKISHSNGSFIDVPEKLKNSWCDLEVLSVTDPTSSTEDKEKIDKLSREVEEDFLKGNEVKWLNFWFQGQVLERSIHSLLKKDVEVALSENDGNADGKVTSSVFLYHQPGAGGTTVAKQTLWELRRNYRCCVVLDFTTETCNQLQEIYLLDDDHPKPLLLLLDNFEDEKFERLRFQLEERGHKIQAETEGVSDIFCVLLICSRHASIPFGDNKKILKQELDVQELKSFQDKYKHLKTTHENNKNRVNPRYLISFNLLVKNFDREYLQHLVQEFATGITNENETIIIQIVSLLNTFDSQFSPIPVSCFDILLDKRQFIFQNTAYSYGVLSRRINWEAKVSQCFKVLLNLSSGRNQYRSQGHTIRVFNKLLAKEILDYHEKKLNVTPHKIMLGLLQSRLYGEENRDVKIIQKIIKNVICHRQYENENNFKRQPFSELILSIKEHEGSEKAMQILEIFYNASQNPFTAQLIARFCITLKDFEKAEVYAGLATRDADDNSYVWNTFGQVYFNQLKDMVCDRKSMSSPKFQKRELPTLINLFQKCLKYFRYSQERAHWESDSSFQEKNIAGYLDEVRSTLEFLSALEMCLYFDSLSELHRFLVDHDFLVAMDLKATNFIKSIAFECRETIQKLEEELMATNSDRKKDDLEMKNKEYEFTTLLYLRSKLDDYFGESEDCVPQGLSEEKTCEFRYRRAVSKIPATLQALLKKSNHQIEIFEESLRFIFNNVLSSSCCFKYLKTMLDLFTAILFRKGTSPYGISYADIQTFSKDLCFKYGLPTQFVYLEKYFYFVLYNFPCMDKQLSGTEVHNLISASENLRKEFKKKHSKNDQRVRKELPLFYLRNGEPLQFQHLIRYAQESPSQLLKMPEARQTLKRLSGILQKEGTSIKYLIMTRENSILPIDIPLLQPLTKRLLFQKKVNFYLGFSFAGLTAIGVEKK